MRINKNLSTQGYCSRREADRLIEQEKVFINNELAGMGDQVHPGDDVRVEGRDRKYQPKKVYLLVHKPIGITTNQDIRRHNNIINFIDYPERLYPVGHLDAQSTGLVLLTNDQVLSDRLQHPRYQLDDEFVVEVDRPISRLDISAMQNGIELDEGKTLPAKVRLMDPTRFAIILPNNLDHQIQRMCDAMEYRIHNLIRTRMGALKMASTYPEGNWRHLTDREVKDLKKSVDMTIKVNKIAKPKKKKR